MSTKREFSNDESAELLKLILPMLPQLTVEQQLDHAQYMLRRLVEHYRITEYAAITPLHVSCDACYQPYFEDEEEYGENHFDDLYNLSMCYRCVQLGKQIISDKKQKQ